jgi:hypothetical protein
MRGDCRCPRDVEKIIKSLSAEGPEPPIPAELFTNEAYRQLLLTGLSDLALLSSEEELGTSCRAREFQQYASYAEKLVFV